MKTGLPDSHLITAFNMNRMRSAAFYQLHGFFKSGCFARGDEYMKMIRHYDKFMKLISCFVTTGENALNQDFRHLRHSEQLAPFPSGR